MRGLLCLTVRRGARFAVSDSGAKDEICCLTVGYRQGLLCLSVGHRMRFAVSDSGEKDEVCCLNE